MSSIEVKKININKQLDFLQSQIDAINDKLENETDQDVIDALLKSLEDLNNQYKNKQTQLNLIGTQFIELLNSTYNVTDNEWQDTENIEKFCNNEYSYNVLNISGETELVSDTLSISEFNFNIPYNATITGIKVKINKKADKNDEDTQIFDNMVRLHSNSMGYSISKPNGGSWSEDVEDIFYGSDNDLWNYGIVDPDDINNNDFKVLFNCIGYDYTSYGITNVAYVDCVCVDVYYSLPGIEDGLIYIMTEEKNTVFDDRLHNFGDTGELINSKINEIESPLKIKDNDMDKSIYPIIDEFGYNFNKKFIFKSSWDNDYYIRTKKDLE